MSLATQQSLESHYVMHTFGRSPVEFVEGHGMKLTGDDGREYLDFLAGIGVCSLGHGNLAVLSALEAQTKKLMHVSNYFYIEQRGQVAALLLLHRAEMRAGLVAPRAIRMAILLARKHRKRSFHENQVSNGKLTQDIVGKNRSSAYSIHHPPCHIKGEHVTLV